MRDICLIWRDAGHLVKMRDCPAKCGTVDTYMHFSLPPRKLRTPTLSPPWKILASREAVLSCCWRCISCLSSTSREAVLSCCWRCISCLSSTSREAVLSCCWRCISCLSSTSREAVLSCCWRCISCLSSTVWANSGFRNENRVLGWRFKNSSAGLLPVVVWGVLRYSNRKFANLWFNEPCMPSHTFSRRRFRIWTDRSAAPLEDGW